MLQPLLLVLLWAAATVADGAPENYAGKPLAQILDQFDMSKLKYQMVSLQGLERALTEEDISHQQFVDLFKRYKIGGDIGIVRIPSMHLANRYRGNADKDKIQRDKSQLAVLAYFGVVLTKEEEYNFFPYFAVQEFLDTEKKKLSTTYTVDDAYKFVSRFITYMRDDPDYFYKMELDDEDVN
nr:CP52k-like protein 20 [Membranobalanus longirostrum]